MILVPIAKVILVVAGAVTITLTLCRIYLFLSFHFLPFGKSLERYQRQPRAWAIVTGASAGIGFGHVQELAARGFGVIVLGHKEDEVDEAVAKVKSEFKSAAVEKIILDVTKASFSDIKAAFTPFMHLPITILVNNVSVSTSSFIFTSFKDLAAPDIYSSLAGNNLFQCYLTSILYPVLKTNGPSLIINISSGSHAIGLPWLAVYCGTKAFTESWSKAMSREAKVLGDQIDSISILPGDVRTQKNVYGVAAGSPDGRQFAKMTLDRAGRAVQRGMKVVCSSWRDEITFWLTRTLPDHMIEEPMIADIANRKALEAKGV